MGWPLRRRNMKYLLPCFGVSLVLHGTAKTYVNDWKWPPWNTRGGHVSLVYFSTSPCPYRRNFYAAINVRDNVKFNHKGVLRSGASRRNDVIPRDLYFRKNRIRTRIDLRKKKVVYQMSERNSSSKKKHATSRRLVSASVRGSLYVLASTMPLGWFWRAATSS